MATVQGESSSHVKPNTPKEAITRVLQEAGPGGLHAKEIVKRLKKKKWLWWDWKKDEEGYDQVFAACSRNPDVFVHVPPENVALLSLQDDDFDPNVKPKSLKKAITLLLQEAGPEGLHAKEIVQRLKKKKWWWWEKDEEGYDQVLLAARSLYPAVFVHVPPENVALLSLQDDDFDPSVRPETLKEAITLLLQEAGPEGLHAKEIVQRLKKKKWWWWEKDEEGYVQVSAACRKHPAVFVHVPPENVALLSLQDDDFDPNVKPKTLKKAIILVLQEAGPGGLHAKEIVQRLKKKKWWWWEKDEEGYDQVSAACRKHPAVFVHVPPEIWALVSTEGKGKIEYWPTIINEVLEERRTNQGNNLLMMSHQDILIAARGHPRYNEIIGSASCEDPLGALRTAISNRVKNGKSNVRRIKFGETSFYWIITDEQKKKESPSPELKKKQPESVSNHRQFLPLHLDDSSELKARYDHVDDSQRFKGESSKTCFVHPVWGGLDGLSDGDSELE